MTQGNVLIIGCGKLGIRTARLLQREGYQVTAARRSPAALPDDIHGTTVDVCDTASLGLLSAKPWRAVIVTLTAGDYTAGAYQKTYVDGLANVLQALEGSNDSGSTLVLFASSTSIYGQDDGSVVDENSATEPAGFSGEAMLAAEQCLQQSPLDTVAVRFAGIYGEGPGRLAGRAASGELCPASPMRYSNRIHIHDCARVLVHLVQRYRQGESLHPCYLAVDNAPAPLREVMEWLALRQGVNASAFRDGPMPQRGGNKRCSNRLLLESGFHFDYPDYRAGYGELLPGAEQS